MARSWLEGLLGLFSSDALDPGEFEAIPSSAIPEPSRKLLDHHHHMMAKVKLLLKILLASPVGTIEELYMLQEAI